MKRLICIFLLFGAVHTSAIAVEESPELARTYAKLKQIRAKKNVQVNIGIVGDSVANNKPRVIRPWFELAFPKATEGILTYVLSGNATVSDGSGARPWDNTYSFTGEIFTISDGGSVWFGSGGGWVAATRTVIYYEKGPTLGRFKLQRALGWGNSTWQDEPGYLSVDCSASSRGWGKIVLTNSFQMTRLRFVHVGGGPVRFPLRPIFRNLAYPGVTFRSLDRGGLGLPDAVSGDRTILVDYLRELDLDLAFFEMKEDPSYYAAALENFRDLFDEAKPTTEWIYVGSSPLSPQHDPNQTKQATENAILAAHATARGGYYFDGYSLVGTYANMVANKWQGDGIHEALACSQYLAGKLWEDIGYLIAPWITAVPAEGSADTVDFGAVDFGATPTRTFTLVNTGTVAARDLAATWSGVGFNGTLAGNGTLSVGGNATYTINVPAGAEGDKAGTLTFTANSSLSLNGTTTVTPVPVPVETTATRLNALQTWRRSQFATLDASGDAADAADPDGDGVTNLFEFLGATDPKAGDFIAPVVTTGNGTLTYAYRRSRAAVADGWTFSVQWSDALPGASWSSGNVTEQVTASTATAEQVTATVPAGATAQRFLRLDAARP